MEPNLLYRAVVDLCLLLFIANLSSEIASRIRVPRLLGVLVAGAIFSPNLLGGIQVGGRPLIEINELILMFTEIGAVLILFASGLDMTFDEFRKVGLTSFLIGTVDIVFCFIVLLCTSIFLGFGFVTSLILAGALSSTSIAVTALTLKGLGKIDTLESKVIINTAVIDDILSLTILTVILNFVSNKGSLSPLRVGELIGSALVYWFLILLLGVYFIPSLIDRTKNIGAGVMESMAILICFGMAALASMIGFSPLVGAFSAGMAISSSKSRIKVKNFIKGIELIFIPLFFIVMGAGIDLVSMISGSFSYIIILIIIAMASKFLACGIPAIRLLKDVKSGIRVGIGMMSRGEIGLVIASFSLFNGMITKNVYTIIVGVTCFTILIAPFLLRMSYKIHSPEKHPQKLLARA